MSEVSLPLTLRECHDLILSLVRENADLAEELAAEREFGFQMLDDREFCVANLEAARLVGTTRLGFYGRISDPYPNCPEEVP